MRRACRRIDSVIVLDLDDTLYLEADYVESGLHAVGVWARVQLDTVDLADAMIARFRSGQRTRLFDDALAGCGIVPTPALIARMLRVYRQHRPDIALAPDAAAFLASRSPRTGLAIVTDGFLEAQTRKLRALRVHRHGIMIAVCTDRWGRDAWKPAPRAFHHIAAHFALAADAFCYVGDNCEKDFHAPAALGWRTVRIARPGIVDRPFSASAMMADRCIASFTEW